MGEMPSGTEKCTKKMIRHVVYGIVKVYMAECRNELIKSAGN